MKKSLSKSDSAVLLSRTFMVKNPHTVTLHKKVNKPTAFTDLPDFRYNNARLGNFSFNFVDPLGRTAYVTSRAPRQVLGFPWNNSKSWNGIKHFENIPFFHSWVMLKSVVCVFFYVLLELSNFWWVNQIEIEEKPWDSLIKCSSMF